MIGSAIGGLFEFLFRLVFGLLFLYTGEIILLLLSFGKRIPIWKRPDTESLTKSFIFMEISFWIGLFFWILMVNLIVNLIT